MVLFYSGMDKTWCIWIQFFLLSGILMREMIVTLNEWLWGTDTWVLAQGGVTSQPTHTPLSSFVMVVSTVSLTEGIYRHTFPILICTIQAIGHDQRSHTQWKSFWQFSALPRAERWLLSGRFPFVLFNPHLQSMTLPLPPRVLATLILRITGFNLYHSIFKSKIDLGITQFSLLVFFFQ